MLLSLSILALSSSLEVGEDKLRTRDHLERNIEDLFQDGFMPDFDFSDFFTKLPPDDKKKGKTTGSSKGLDRSGFYQEASSAANAGLPSYNPEEREEYRSRPRPVQETKKESSGEIFRLKYVLFK